MTNALSPRSLNGWRIAGWGSLVALLVLPALAMQLTSEVNWTASDFVFAAVLLGFVGAVVELAARFARPERPASAISLPASPPSLLRGRTQQSA